jgi:superfamily II DNA/RNA helicase
VSPMKLPRGTLRTDPQCRSSECTAAEGKNSGLTLVSQLGLAEPTLRALQSEGYDKPARMLIGLAGRDQLGIAQTGTGKVAILAVPVIRQRVAKECKVSYRAPAADVCRACAPGNEACERTRRAFGL